MKEDAVMTCQQNRDRILLDDAGELETTAAASLRVHLAGCAACRTYREQVRAVVGLAARELPDAGPSAFALERIRVAAGRQTGRLPLRFRRAVAVTLACAASLLAAAGLRVRLGAGAHWLRIERTHALVSLVSVQPSARDSEPAARDRSAAMQALAEELLRMEGLSFEPGEEAEESTLSEEPEPRAPRARNTGGGPPETYG